MPCPRRRVHAAFCTSLARARRSGVHDVSRAPISALPAPAGPSTIHFSEPCRETPTRLRLITSSLVHLPSQCSQGQTRAASRCARQTPRSALLRLPRRRTTFAHRAPSARDTAPGFFRTLRYQARTLPHDSNDRSRYTVARSPGAWADIGPVLTRLLRDSRDSVPGDRAQNPLGFLPANAWHHPTLLMSRYVLLASL